MSPLARLTRFPLGALAIFAFGLISPALAGVDEEHDTPSGLLRLISTDDLEVEIHVGDEVFPYAEGMSAQVVGKFGNVFLIFLASGGNACPGNFIWLDTSLGHVRATEPFGTCSDLFEVTSTDETITATVKSMMPGEGDHAYTWDGEGQVVETVLDLQPSDTPPGTDPRGWLGRHPAELLDSSDWEELLLNGLTADELDELRMSMKLSSGFVEQDGWVAAYGYDNISDGHGAIALHPDGELLVVLGAVGQEGTLWGVTDHPYPEAIQQVLDGY